MSHKDTPAQIRFDEREHVEKPLLDQLSGLVFDLDAKQHPADSHRATLAEVVMLPVLREQQKVIQPWLEDDQVEDLLKQITTAFPGSGLLQNNEHAFDLLTKGASVAENRQTGERSPTAYFLNIVRAKVPFAEKAKVWLKEHGQMLEEGV